MKYEMIFGDEALFDGAPDDVDMIGYNGGFYKNSQGGPMYCCGCTFTTDEYRNKGFIAMRRIIKEPKLWTLEDKKAGRLPEVGAKCSHCHSVDERTVLSVTDKYVGIECDNSDINPYFVTHAEFIKYYIPIETPEEKAQREEDEWVNKAWGETAVFARVTQDEHDRLRIHLRHIYRAQLSGKLAVPKGGE